MLLISHNEEETEQIGLMIGKKLKGREIIALWGTMGMGKTAITRGIASAFGMYDLVSSPTFSIVNEYKNEKQNIYHFDFYRVSSDEELETTGFYYYMGKGIMIIEWSENIEKYVPKEAINIVIRPAENESERRIEISGGDFR